MSMMDDLIPSEGYCTDCGQDNVRLGMVRLRQLDPDPDHPDPDYIGPCEVVAEGRCMPCSIAFARALAGGVN
jgi:hypothetical protein